MFVNTEECYNFSVGIKYWFMFIRRIGAIWLLSYSN